MWVCAASLVGKGLWWPVTESGGRQQASALPWFCTAFVQWEPYFIGSSVDLLVDKVRRYLPRLFGGEETPGYFSDCRSQKVTTAKSHLRGTHSLGDFWSQMISLHVLVLVEHVLAVSNWLGPHLAFKRHHHLVCVSIVVIPWICHLALFDTNMCKCTADIKVSVSLPTAAASVPSSSTVFCAVHCLLASLLYSPTSPSLLLHLSISIAVVMDRSQPRASCDELWIPKCHGA